MKQVGGKLHIGIILDGNRRYAKKKKIMPWEGHKVGADKVFELLEWGKKLNVSELTLYTFSIENFNRPEKEKKFLFNLFKENMRKLDRGKLKKDGTRVHFIGRLDMFPEGLYEEMHKLMNDTRDNKDYKINFAMAYGGRAEIVDAVKKISMRVKKGELDETDICEELITSNVYLPDEPDLIIRPGGEKRVSNFLIWQSYYSEWYFTDKLWPEFTKEDFSKAIEEYMIRERRFGR